MIRLLPVFCFLVFMSCWFRAPAQGKYFTKTGKVSFLSAAPLENIEAVNKTTTAVLDTRSGAVQAMVLMRGFEFKKALMQEHFNENYVESHKYPKAEFRGTLLNNNEIAYNEDGTYKTTLKGQLSMHGITKEVLVPAVLTVRDGKIVAMASFPILLSDYNIAIPALVKDKISNSVKVTLEIKLEPLVK